MSDQNGDRYKIYEVAENMISLFTILALRLLNNAGGRIRDNTVWIFRLREDKREEKEGNS